MVNSAISVLVVDDDEFVRINLLAFLEDEGLMVLSATSGEIALDLLADRPVDVALVDMRLPGMDGNAFIQQAHERHPQVRFIIHTGSIDYTLPDSLKKIGVDQDLVFHKPVSDMKILHQAILSAMSRDGS